MSPPLQNSVRERRYGFACLTCRRRKVRCDGKKPSCDNCNRARETCNYKESPSYNAQLISQLQKSKKYAHDLERHLRELASLSPDNRDRRLVEINQELDQLNMTSPSSSPMHLDQQPSVNLTGNAAFGDALPSDAPANFGGSFGENGTYYGATSRFYPLRLNDNSLEGADEEPREIEASEEYHRKWLASQAKFHGSLEKLAIKNIPQYTDVDLDVCVVLLQIYWTWQAPLHNCVYRRCFYRDLALDGPYFSPFLLHVMFAHACRHTKDDDERFSRFERGEYFLRKARHLLMEELERETPKICTIQGLLILGGRQCAIGKSSEGWLYTGMAIRMVTDLGLHLYRGNLNGLRGMEPDDLEVRKRVYLSAFAWDKSISLCLGRAPSLPELHYSPDSLFDTLDDDSYWTPFYLKETPDSYPATKSYNTLNFIHFCKLAKIINELYHTVYGKSLHHLKIQSILDLETKLRSFYRDLPDALRIDLANSSPSCPPPHIFCLNILYHTMLILIFRPFFGWSLHSKLEGNALAIRAHKVCTEEATKVNDFFHLYGRAFDFQNQTYLVSYCVYTAATIDIQQIRHEDQQIATAAADRLSVTLEMLGSEAKQTPGIKRSIEIIQSHLGQPSQLAGRQLNQATAPGQLYCTPDLVNGPPDGSLVARQSSHDQNTLVSRGNGNMPTMSEQPLESPVGMGAIDITVHHQTPPGQYLPERDGGSLMAEEIAPGHPWSDWGSFNPGGGFVLDYDYWTSFDPASHFSMD